MMMCYLVIILWYLNIIELLSHSNLLSLHGGVLSFDNDTLPHEANVYFFIMDLPLYGDALLFYYYMLLLEADESPLSYCVASLNLLVSSLLWFCPVQWCIAAV
jgi:hypothetical protein